MKKWFGKMKGLLLITLLTILLAGCGEENLTSLIPKGYGAESSFYLIVLTTVVMTFVFLAVMIIYTIVLIRFRKNKGEEDYIPKQVEGSKTLETIWTVIPIILVIIMAVPTVIATFDLADASDADEHININVTGKQFWWHFDYETEEIHSSQDLYIPVNTKVYLHVKSNDVLHSFWVPSLSGKIDANPENINTIFIEAYEEGVYQGLCAELCGLSHSLMDFKVIVVSEEEYQQWVSDMKNVKADDITLDAVAQDGKALFEENNCLSCHAIDTPEEYSKDRVPVGPDLTNFGNREKLAGVFDLTKENIAEWIVNNEEMKPGNKMLNVYLEPDEAEKIAEYLLQLKHSDVTSK